MLNDPPRSSRQGPSCTEVDDQTGSNKLCSGVVRFSEGRSNRETEPVPLNLSFHASISSDQLCARFRLRPTLPAFPLSIPAKLLRSSVRFIRLKKPSVRQSLARTLYPTARLSSSAPFAAHEDSG